MKKIIISLIITCFLLPIVDATTLVPSLTTQIARQEKINIKNTYISRLAEIENKRAAARARLLALKNRNNKSVPMGVTIIPTKSTTVTRTSSTDTSIVTQSSPILSPSGVDMSRVKSTWIGWYNDVRQSEGLNGYTYDVRLDATAYDWNQVFADGKGLNHHTRNPGDGYYNFAVIDAWFATRGINPKVINKSKHAENVGYGYYSCNSSDCTDSLIHSIRSTFDFFMSEKGKAYNAHYRSIVQPNFSKIGLSVIVVPGEQRYYLTVHYITE